MVPQVGGSRQRGSRGRETCMAVWAMRRVMSLAPFTLTGRHEPFCCLHTHAPSRPYSLQCTIMPCTNKLPSRTWADFEAAQVQPSVPQTSLALNRSQVSRFGCVFHSLLRCTSHCYARCQQTHCPCMRQPSAHPTICGTTRNKP